MQKKPVGRRWLASVLAGFSGLLEGVFFSFFFMARLLALRKLT